MGIPVCVDCKKCINANTVLCMSCVINYKTAPYLNYSETYATTTNQTTRVKIKQ